MSSQIDRREFLGCAAAAGAVVSGLYVNPSPASESESPNEKLNIAVVGAANKGWHNVQQLTSENIVALCDIDSKYLARAAEQFPKASQYCDYRRMLDAEQKNIDAIVVSTADHTHAPPTAVDPISRTTVDEI